MELTNIQMRGVVNIINKAGSGWLPFASVNSTGAESVMDLTNVGTIIATGNVGIGTTTPSSRLDVNGSVRVGTDATVCSASIQGSIRMNGTALEYCNGSSWSALSVGSGITALTGDVSAAGPGSSAATVNSVGGVTAANVASGANLALAGTSANTASTLVKRDASGNFSAGTITANLTGNVTGNVSGSAASFTGSLAGDVTGTQSATVVSKVNGGSVPASAVLLATNGSSQLAAVTTVPTSALPAFTGGDVTSSAGSLALTLTNSGATAGTYSKVTVDAKGRVTLGANLASGDIATALGYTPVNKAGDTMTGALNLPSNGLAVGTSQVVVSGGNVGIGTTNPGAKLEINGGGSNVATNLFSGATASYSAIQFGRTGVDANLAVAGSAGQFSNTAVAGDTILRSVNGNLILGAYNGSGSISLTTGATDTAKVTILNGGKVGIGTITPNAILEAYGTGANSALIVPRDSTANRPIGINGMLRYNTNTNQFEAYSNGTWGSLGSGSSSQWTTSGSNIYFNSGNVGIGTTAPSYNLDVSGQGRLQSANAQVFQVTGLGTGYADATNGVATIYSQNTAGTGGNVLKVGSAYAPSALTVKDSGNVGIGTTAPTETLSVNGSIRGAPTYANGASTTIDWSRANTQSTTAGCSGTPFTFSNMRDGGVYTLVVTGSFSANCTFAQTSPDTLSGTPGSGAFYFLPANDVPTGGNAMYSFSRVGNAVYVNWSSGYTN